MAFDIPTDLIRQVQISLRNQAGLSDYDPEDPTLPALPSLGASIAAYDPSPPYLRCKHCKGRLLRGLQSVICVYCGKPHQNDVAPEPISFNSTFGYRWLLESLDLEESEKVGASGEENEFKRGQSMPKEDISLSELLDLKIAWPAERNKPEITVTKPTLQPSNTSSNFTGVDLDNFFSGPRGGTVLNISQEQPGINEQIESTHSKAFAGLDNPSVFQNVQPSETAIRSFVDESGDAFSGWEADFQSANSGNQPESAKSVDPFVGSTVDVSTHRGLVSGRTKDFKDGKLKDDSTPSPSVSNDWIQDDQSNIPPMVSQQDDQIDATITLKDDPSLPSVTNDWILQAEKFDDIVKAKEDPGLDDANKASSTSVGWLQDDHWLANNKNAPNNKTINEDNDSFDEWNDFAISSIAQDRSTSAWTQSGNESAAVNEQASERSFLSSTNNFEDMDFGNFLHPDPFSGSLGNQNGSAGENNILPEVTASNRIADAKTEVGGDGGEAAESIDIFSTTTRPKDDVETLLSQMHDLSFMLESNLSVPTKLDSLNSSAQD
ncbi:unnamed protein product [Ilex paraguariensis]|uniref:DUF7815 domain-containing protein n=1 Tax=Ilex paraguariensis TaxID=185542 RepID=A0ABC8RV30_9AQUA